MSRGRRAGRNVSSRNIENRYRRRVCEIQDVVGFTLPVRSAVLRAVRIVHQPRLRTDWTCAATTCEHRMDGSRARRTMARLYRRRSREHDVPPAAAKLPHRATRRPRHGGPHPDPRRTPPGVSLDPRRADRHRDEAVRSEGELGVGQQFRQFLRVHAQSTDTQRASSVWVSANSYPSLPLHDSFGKTQRRRS